MRYSRCVCVLSIPVRYAVCKSSINGQYTGNDKYNQLAQTDCPFSVRVAVARSIPPQRRSSLGAYTKTELTNCILGHSGSLLSLATSFLDHSPTERRDRLLFVCGLVVVSASPSSSPLSLIFEGWNTTATSAVDRLALPIPCRGLPAMGSRDKRGGIKQPQPSSLLLCVLCFSSSSISRVARILRFHILPFVRWSVAQVQETVRRTDRPDETEGGGVRGIVHGWRTVQFRRTALKINRFTNSSKTVWGSEMMENERQWFYIYLLW